jgi:hypothetical protein
MRWSDAQLGDALVRAFPDEKSGAAALDKSLKEHCRVITLHCYLTEIADACELAQPTVDVDKHQCMKNPHRELTPKDANAAACTFKLELDKKFAGVLPTTIADYRLAAKRE